MLWKYPAIFDTSPYEEQLADLPELLNQRGIQPDHSSKPSGFRSKVRTKKQASLRTTAS